MHGGMDEVKEGRREGRGRKEGRSNRMMKLESFNERRK
jgi:hypothetical protein